MSRPSIKDILMEKEYPEDIAQLAGEIGSRIFGFKRSLSSFEIFTDLRSYVLSDFYIATSGNDALRVFEAEGFGTFKLGKYSLTDEGEKACSYESIGSIQKPSL